MEIPVTREWMDPSKFEVWFLLIQMGCVVLGFGIVTWWIAAMWGYAAFPKKNFRQVSIATLAALVVTGIVGGYYHWAFPKVERRTQQETITQQSISDEVQRVYGMTLVKRTDDDFPHQYDPVEKWVYLVKDAAGKESKCIVSYDEKPSLRTIKGIGWESVFLRVPKYAKQFRDEPERKVKAKLLCDKQEPKRIN